MKKKLLSLLLVAVMALSLVACGGNKEEESGNAEVKSKVETDAAKRAEIFKELQQKVAEEALFYPFGTNLRIFVTNPALQGMEEDAKFVPIYTFDDFSKLYFE